MTKTKTWMTQHTATLPRKPVNNKPANIVEEEQEVQPKKSLSEPENVLASKSISKPIKKQVVFDEDSAEQALIYYSGMSVYFGAEDSIKQRMLCYVPLEVISATACINYHLAFQTFCEYILDKFNLEYQPNSNLQTLYFKLPEYIQNDIREKITFEPSIFEEIPTFDKLRDYKKDTRLAFDNVQFFMTVTRKLRSVALNIHQNTLYV